jgi:CheY-like chemotaxis protein/HPt (histidine-containing phosphotransfer) domain-containing protein
VHIESVASGHDGLAAARAAALADAPFDAVLLDYQMPEMDGMTFLRELRSDPLTTHVKCIVFSTPGERGAETEALEVSAWLTKPVRKAHLHRALGRIVAAGTTRLTSAEGAKYPDARVLLVEDNPVNQKVAALLLNTFGIEPRLASDGAQALAAVRAEPFDLVLMDCQMPVQDGYETTRRLRAWEQSREGGPAAAGSSAGPRLPIIALTANAMAGDREKCLSAGMDDYIAKPIKRKVLAATLARWLASPEAEQMSGALEMSSTGQTQGDDVLDNDVLAELRSVIGAGLADVLRTFLRNIPAQLASMTAAIEQRDYAVLGRCAHSVKSSSQSLGAMALGRVAAELEYVTRTNGALSEVERLTVACHAAFRILEPLVIRTVGETDPQASGLNGAPGAPPRFVQGSVPSGNH